MTIPTIQTSSTNHLRTETTGWPELRRYQKQINGLTVP